MNVGGREIPVDKQRACFFLRIGANENVHSILRKLAISEGAVSTCVRRVATAIGDHLGDYVTMPGNGTPRKAAVKKQFKTREPAFKDAVGIVDFTCTTVPTGERCAGNIAAYLDRKGKPTPTFQAITTCEDSPRFLSLAGGVPGAAYDTLILQTARTLRGIPSGSGDPEDGRAKRELLKKVLGRELIFVHSLMFNYVRRPPLRPPPRPLPPRRPPRRLPRRRPPSRP